MMRQVLNFIVHLSYYRKRRWDVVCVGPRAESAKWLCLVAVKNFAMGRLELRTAVGGERGGLCYLSRYRADSRLQGLRRRFVLKLGTGWGMPGRRYRTDTLTACS